MHQRYKDVRDSVTLCAPHEMAEFRVVSPNHAKLCRMAITMQTTDAELVQLTLSGDNTAFGGLVQRYQGLIYGLAYHQVGDFMDAEDVAQEAFVKAFRSLGQLEKPERFAAWLKTITVNECRMRLRSRRRTVTLDEIDASPAYASLADERWRRRERHAEVRQAVDSLPEERRLMVTLHYLSGLSHREIGEFLDMPANTVAQHLHRARRQLREMLMMQIEEGYAMNKLPDTFTENVLERLTLFPIEEQKLTTATGEGDIRGFIMGVGERTPGQSFITLWMREDDLTGIVLGLYQARTSESAKGRAMDSTLSILSALEIGISRVVLRLADGRKCRARVDMKQGDTELTMDMRPSDAMGLAVRAKAPIYVEEPVVRRGNVGEDDVPVPDEAMDAVAWELESRRLRQHDALTGKAFEMGLSPEDWIDTVRFRKDEAKGLVRMWLEAFPERELSFDLKDYGPGVEMIFELAQRQGSTGLMRGDLVRGWDKRYKFCFSLLCEDARMRALPETTET